MEAQGVSIPETSHSVCSYTIQIWITWELGEKTGWVKVLVLRCDIQALFWPDMETAQNRTCHLEGVHLYRAQEKGQPDYWDGHPVWMWSQAMDLHIILLIKSHLFWQAQNIKQMWRSHGNNCWLCIYVSGCIISEMKGVGKCTHTRDQADIHLRNNLSLCRCNTVIHTDKCMQESSSHASHYDKVQTFSMARNAFCLSRNFLMLMIILFLAPFVTPWKPKQGYLLPQGMAKGQNKSFPEASISCFSLWYSTRMWWFLYLWLQPVLCQVQHLCVLELLEEHGVFVQSQTL